MKAADFVQRMNTPAEASPVRPTTRAKKSTRNKAPARGKHLGGYFGAEVIEQFALLRARLNLDNSELIELAIADLWRKHSSRQAFGD
jgi:hypothetical protein